MRKHCRSAVHLWAVAGDQRQPVSIELRVMESRTGLIERAAALLREAGQEGPAHPSAPPAGTAPLGTAPLGTVTSGAAGTVEARSGAGDPPSEVRPPLGASPATPLRQ